MFGKTISAALASLAPFWSNEIVKAYSLGNEYSMAINMILTEIIKLLPTYLTDEIFFILISVIIVAGILIYFKITIIDLNIFETCNNATVVGIEINDNGAIRFIHTKAFKAINLMLINKYKIKNLQYLNDAEFDIIVDTMNNFKLEKDLYITVKKELKTNGTNEYKKIYITLSSYTKNIKEIIKNAMNEYNDDKKNKLIFVGQEPDNVTFNYPESMKYLTYVLINIYGMSKLKVLLENTHEDKKSYWKESNDDKKNDINNMSKTKKEADIKKFLQYIIHFNILIQYSKFTKHF